jgi:serine/threonine-protein kinase
MPAFEEQETRRIGRYEVIRKIATGGMAELFLARFVGPGGFEKRCALKRILPQFAADKVFTKMFLTEARVTAMFDHPNLVQIFELGQDDEGQFFIAMELVNGMNLRQLLGLHREKGVQMPPELAAYMMTQALDGLQYAHDFKGPDGVELNLVHRDVSPQNLLISYDGAVKIVDFGIVKGNSISSETQAGMLKGKVAYMSPEQAAGEPIDARSDLFSIGVVLYELIAGEKPFTGANEVMCLKSILDDAVPPITKHAPECPEDIENIVYRALEKSRDQRYQSAREFQVELQAVLTACPTPLGRHVVADYIKSFTDENTSSFDSTKLKIPRASSSSAPSMRHHDMSGFEPTIETSAVDPNLKAPATPMRGGRSSYTPTPSRTGRTPTNGASKTQPVTARAQSLDGLSGESEVPSEVRRAAGLGRVNPAIAVVFAASALAGGLVMWFATRDARTVVVEASPPVNVEVPRPVKPDDAAKAAEAAKAEAAKAEAARAEAAKTEAAKNDAQKNEAGKKEAAEAAKREKAEALEAAKREKAEKAEAAKREKEERLEAAKREKAEKAEATKREKAEKAEAAKAEAAKKGHDRATDHPAVGGGTLTLTSVPRGLSVSIDEKPFGKTPLVGVNVPAGSHTVKLVNKQLGILKTMPVRITKGMLTTETMTVGKGTLKVNSRPWADVFVDGVSKGKTPLETPIYEGMHEVRLVSPEAGERIQKVEVKTGATEDVRVKF